MPASLKWSGLSNLRIDRVSTSWIDLQVFSAWPHCKISQAVCVRAEHLVFIEGLYADQLIRALCKSSLDQHVYDRFSCTA